MNILQSVFLFKFRPTSELLCCLTLHYVLFGWHLWTYLTLILPLQKQQRREVQKRARPKRFRQANSLVTLTTSNRSRLIQWEFKPARVGSVAIPTRWPPQFYQVVSLFFTIICAWCGSYRTNVADNLGTLSEYLEKFQDNRMTVYIANANNAKIFENSPFVAAEWEVLHQKKKCNS